MNWPRVTPVRRDAARSVLAGVGAQAVLTITGIVSARILGVENRGYLAMLTLVPTVLVQLGSAGLPHAASYFIARDPRRAVGIVRCLAGPWIVQSIALTICQASVIAVLLGDGSPSLRLASAFSLAATSALLLQQYGLAVLQGLGRFGVFSIAWLLPASFYALFLLAAVAARSGDLALVAALWTAANLSGALVTAVWAFRASKRAAPEAAATIPGLKELIRFGMKGLLGSVSPVETFRLDQATVAIMRSPFELGLYAVALAFANLPGFVGKSVGAVSSSAVAVRTTATDARALAWKYTYVVGAVCALVAGSLALAAEPLTTLLFGEAFAGAARLMRVLVVSASLLAVRRVLAEGAKGAGYPALGTIAECASLLVLVPGLCLLTPAWGANGVAIALAIASGLSLAVLVIGFGTPRRPGVLVRDASGRDVARIGVSPASGGARN